ncbi:hypothetical protein [Oleiharenicola lentus]|uniref:hypothetical protein n=1 Tax=Oleiharenicola lentus TaxID=2508720 RepID=UPI003F66FD4F
MSLKQAIADYASEQFKTLMQASDRTAKLQAALQNAYPAEQASPEGRAIEKLPRLPKTLAEANEARDSLLREANIASSATLLLPESSGLKNSVAVTATLACGNFLSVGQAGNIVKNLLSAHAKASQADRASPLGKAIVAFAKPYFLLSLEKANAGLNMIKAAAADKPWEHFSASGNLSSPSGKTSSVPAGDSPAAKLAFYKSLPPGNERMDFAAANYDALALACRESAALPAATTAMPQRAPQLNGSTFPEFRSDADILAYHVTLSGQPRVDFFAKHGDVILREARRQQRQKK